MRSLTERFWEKVDIRGKADCWPWTAYRSPHGYGRIGRGGKRGRIETASRLAWELRNGPIPDGLHVLHRCDNPACCNPAHLFLGTHGDNVRDMYAKGRANRPKGERHCCARFTPEQVHEVRRLYATGLFSQRMLGARYGVSHKAIGNVVSRRTWGH